MDDSKLDKVIHDLEKLTKSKSCPFVCFDALELLKEYKEAKPLIDAISDSVHETAKMFRQNDGLKHYDDGSSEP